ncbi:cation/H+ exchanger 23 [Euphorbia peplus]|nr:cation/H+ exchanger 23 [Euphorbia peplus]
MKSYQPLYQLTKTDDGILACYNPESAASFYIGGNPSSTISSLPYFIMEITLILFTNRLCILILNQFRQPPFVAYFVSGALLGSAGLGHTVFFQTRIFPFQIMEFLETMANLSITFYMFLIGLEIDLHPILENGRKTSVIALSGIIFPFCVGTALFFFAFDPKETDFKGCIFWAVALTATNFSELSQILIDLKLLRYDIGKLAFSVSVISDFSTLFLLTISLSLVHAKSYFALLSTSIFVLVSLLIFRPIIESVISYFCKEDDLSDSHLWFILGWVMLFGLITDACGSHSIVGSFIFGAIIPRGGALRFKLMEKLEEYVTEIMMPMFFLVVGQRFEVYFMIKTLTWKTFLLVVVVAFLAKIVSTIIVCLFFTMSLHDAITLGILMNTKGVFALIVINAGRDFKALDNQSFPSIAFAVVAMTSMVEPLISKLSKRKRLGKYKQKTIQSTSETTNMQLRILVCIFSSRDVSSLINLLEASNATKDHPIFVVAFHLVEFIGRTTTMLVMHTDFKARSNKNGIKHKVDQIMDAFELYQQRCNGAFLQPITAVSPWETMHTDICNVAMERQIAFLIIPFHTELVTDGKVEDPNSPFAGISQYILQHAPCSIGLFIDRGLHSITHSESDKNPQVLQIGVIFIGGADDREALTYAARMASHEFVSLNVLRFLQYRDKENTRMNSDTRDEMVDLDFMDKFFLRNRDNESITYVEKVVKSGEETLAAIKENDKEYDLYIIGRAQKDTSAITAGLAEWGQCSELGALGDSLVTSNFTSRTSILVVQHFVNSSMYSVKRLGTNVSVDSRTELMSGGGRETSDNSS